MVSPRRWRCSSERRNVDAWHHRPVPSLTPIKRTASGAGHGPRLRVTADLDFAAPRRHGVAERLVQPGTGCRKPPHQSGVRATSSVLRPGELIRPSARQSWLSGASPAPAVAFALERKRTLPRARRRSRSAALDGRTNGAPASVREGPRPRVEVSTSLCNRIGHEMDARHRRGKISEGAGPRRLAARLRRRSLKPPRVTFNKIQSACSKKMPTTSTLLV